MWNSSESVDIDTGGDTLPVLEAQAKETCFLCFQTFSTDNPSDLNTHQNLGRIYQYLSNFRDSTLINTETTSVLLCELCSNVSAKICTLLKKLEVTQMLIDHQIVELHKLLPVAVDNYSKETCTSNSQQLRRKFKQKCK